MQQLSTNANICFVVFVLTVNTQPNTLLTENYLENIKTQFTKCLYTSRQMENKLIRKIHYEFFLKEMKLMHLIKVKTSGKFFFT